MRNSMRAKPHNTVKYSNMPYVSTALYNYSRMRSEARGRRGAPEGGGASGRNRRGRGGASISLLSRLYHVHTHPPHTNDILLLLFKNYPT